MNQYLITALVDIVLGIIAIRKRDNLAAKALAYILFSASAWSLELYALSSLNNIDILSVVFGVLRWGMFLIPPCFALLTWRLVGGRSQFFLNVIIIPAFAFSLLLCITNVFIFPSVLTATDSGYLPKIDAIYYAFIACFLWSFAGAIGLSIICYRSATNREKQRVKWLLITISVSFIAGMSNIFFMPHHFYLSKYMSSLAHILFVGLLFYSTLQHHLMDLRSALGVSIARGLLLGITVWCCFKFTSFLEPINESSGKIIVFIMCMVFALELYPRVLQFVLPNTRRLFASDSYDFDETLLKLQHALNECVNLDALVNTLDYYLLQIVKINNYSVLLVKPDANTTTSTVGAFKADNRVSIIDGDDSFVLCCSGFNGFIMTDEAQTEIQPVLNKKQAMLSFCVKHDSHVMAIVMMGPLFGHSYYRYDDIRLFEWLQVELGQHFHRIDRLEEMQTQLGQAKKTLSMLGVMNHYHHDIKAPLAIIDGVLSNDIYDKEKQKNIVLEQVERGSRLIATMAGILKGERKRKVQPLSLPDVVKDSVFLFSQGIDDIHYAFSDIPKIMGDADDLKILVINLVKNAMEARRYGESLVLTISTWQTENHVCLSITDTGAGMSKELIAKLWDDVSSNKELGSGIGMQAIKRIADEHHAQIDVRSIEGAGSEFIFKFPLSIAVYNDNVASIKSSYTNKKDHVNKPLAG